MWRQPYSDQLQRWRSNAINMHALLELFQFGLHTITYISRFLINTLQTQYPLAVARAIAIVTTIEWASEWADNLCTIIPCHFCTYVHMVNVILAFFGIFFQ
jgi:hypothetical protein